MYWRGSSAFEESSLEAFSDGQRYRQGGRSAAIGMDSLISRGVIRLQAAEPRVIRNLQCCGWPGPSISSGTRITKNGFTFGDLGLWLIH